MNKSMNSEAVAMNPTMVKPRYQCWFCERVFTSVDRFVSCPFCGREI